MIADEGYLSQNSPIKMQESDKTLLGPGDESASKGTKVSGMNTNVEENGSGDGKGGKGGIADFLREDEEAHGGQNSLAFDTEGNPHFTRDFMGSERTNDVDRLRIRQKKIDDTWEEMKMLLGSEDPSDQVFLEYTKKWEKEGDIYADRTGQHYKVEKIVDEDVALKEVVNEAVVRKVDGPQMPNKEDTTQTQPKGASDLDKLNNLREQGFLDDEELVLAKAKLLEEDEQQDQQQTLGKMLLEEEQRKDTATPMQLRMRCKYGSACYRKNPQHFVDFAHPDDPDWEGALTREGNSLWKDMMAAEAHAEALNKSINAALDRSEVQVIAFCCFEYRALAGKLKRPGSCRFGDQCKYLHANPAHIDSLISRYGMVCDREHEHGTCPHKGKREHP